MYFEYNCWIKIDNGILENLVFYRWLDNEKSVFIIILLEINYIMEC